MDTIDLNREDVLAKRKLRFIEQYEALRAEALQLYPGYELMLGKPEPEHPKLIEVPQSYKPDDEFSKLTGVEQVAAVLALGPLKKPLILPEIQKRGGTVTAGSLNTYLTRGKARGILDNFGNRIWGLKQHFGGIDGFDDPKKAA